MSYIIMVSQTYFQDLLARFVKEEITEINSDPNVDTEGVDPKKFHDAFMDILNCEPKKLKESFERSDGLEYLFEKMTVQGFALSPMTVNHPYMKTIFNAISRATAITEPEYDTHWDDDSE